MKVTTEQLLLSPAGFNVATATPVQRAASRVRDGLRLAELTDNPDVVEAFGGREAVAALPSERGIKPTEFYNVASARTAKTTMAVASAIADTQSIDVSGLGHGEIPRLSILSLKLDVADVPFRRLVDTMQASAVLKPLVADVGPDWILVRHPSGKVVEVKVTAGGRAAGNLAARWSAGLIADEAPRMQGRDEAVTNLEDALSVIRERLLPGAQIQGIGSPWAPFGPIYDLVQERFGKPTDAIVLMRTTGPAGNPSYWTPERLEALRERDDSAWRINALGEFLDPESGLFSPISLRKNTRETPLELLPESGACYAAAVDLAEGAKLGNAVTLVIVEAFEAEDGRPFFKTALAREWRGLGPESYWAEIAACCRRFGLSDVAGDQYAASANADIALRHGITLWVEKTSGPSKLEDFTNLATLVHSDRVELPPDKTVRRDLLGVKKRTTQQGHTIVLLRTSDGRHCDFAPALAAAVKAATVAARIGNLDLSVGGYSGGRAWRGSNESRRL
jgi:hypothetical protein